MKAVGYSIVVTVMAALVFAALGRGDSDSTLRLLGAGGGAAIALVAVALGVCRRNPYVRWDDDPEVSLAPRYFFERRRTPRQATRTPAHLMVNGCTCDAVILSVSATGALLRLRGQPGRALNAQVGQPVRIDNFPAGRLARIGNHGVYVDFAVQFDNAATGGPGLDGEASAASLTGARSPA
jgi:hypothetical protein